jgi:hypothetical protein
VHTSITVARRGRRKRNTKYVLGKWRGGSRQPLNTKICTGKVEGWLTTAVEHSLTRGSRVVVKASLITSCMSTNVYVEERETRSHESSVLRGHIHISDIIGGRDCIILNSSGDHQCHTVRCQGLHLTTDEIMRLNRSL